MKYTLSNQISTQIRNRILFGISLLVIIISIITYYDIRSSFQQIKLKIDSDSETLADYVVSQILVENFESIDLKMQEINKNPIKYQWIDDRHLEVKKEIKWVFPFSWKYYFPIQSVNKNNFGYFLIIGSILNDNQLIYELCGRVIFLLLFSITIVLLFFPLASRLPKTIFIDPVMHILSVLKGNANEFIDNKSMPHEIKEIQNEVIQLIQQASAQSKSTAFMQLATQVAHDIRSPLAALDVVVRSIASIPEEQRILIRNATKRIHDIANNLLTQYKIELTSANIESNNLTPELIADLLASVVSEKKAQYRNLPISFTFKIQDEAYGKFAELNASEFKRVISNLINNAVESITDSGHISLQLKNSSHSLHLLISDTGCGMSDEFLSKIFTGSFISSKKDGSGLGLSHAINLVENEWHGKFSISSKLNEGTQIEILVKESSVPTWFTPQISLKGNETLIILDDDPSIHHVWRQRFSSFLNIQTNFKHFYNPHDLLKWFSHNSLTDLLFLVDYELIGSELSGINVANQLGVLKNSRLVTSRYDDNEIRSTCEKLNLKIIPKSYAAYIPIMKVEPVEFICIDDDKILTEAWKFNADLKGKTVAVFNDIDSVKKMLPQFDLDTPFYIDSNLNGVSGEVFAKWLFDSGYQNLYLATGYPSTHFGNMPWLKKIVDKTIPF